MNAHDEKALREKRCVLPREIVVKVNEECCDCDFPCIKCFAINSHAEPEDSCEHLKEKVSEKRSCSDYEQGKKDEERKGKRGKK